eukprot:CAMPEP_0114229500 /NCGR_PEP_ID=MMETSP0058-20121206/2940_1 /TAXON_ID=36894 /ORGANISM="Pyramimonas parkeae, CCMP726" /LENGTH=592 /DNA_ID=CAMNT_0001340579 /DNA_START=393 /DNA_END=2171 /DNA_ORIENTATION=+
MRAHGKHLGATIPPSRLRWKPTRVVGLGQSSPGVARPTAASNRQCRVPSRTLPSSNGAKRGPTRCDAAPPGKIQGQEDPQWALSDREYPQGEVVLGLEIRSHSVKGSLVDTANGEFIRPGVVAKVEHPSEETILEAVRKVRAHQEWAGPVGCSITRAVWQHLGKSDESASDKLTKALPECRGEVVTTLHTNAAAQAAFSYMRVDLKTERVLCITIGLSMGVVLYESGEQVKREFKHLVWTWPNALRKLQKAWNFEGVAPDFPPEREGTVGYLPLGPHCPWDAWLDLVADYLTKIIAKIDNCKILVVPTGNAASLPTSDMQEELEARCPKGAPFRVIEKPAGMLVKGAACHALKECLYAMRAEKKLAAAIGKKYAGNSYSMISMSPAELQEMFYTLDANSDGHVDMDELTQGCADFGVKLGKDELRGLFLRIANSIDGPNTAQKNEIITFPHLTSWCRKMYSEAKVQMIMSRFEFGNVLDDDRYPLKVVKVAALACRACKKFERTFETLADTHPNVRFIAVNLDQSANTQRLGVELQVEGTPCFIFYRGTSEVSRLKGANVIKFQKALDELLETDDSSFSQVSEQAEKEMSHS